MIDGGDDDCQAEHHTADILPANSFSYTSLKIFGLQTLKLGQKPLHVFTFVST